MPRELVLPAIVMSLAFVFYTAGVFSERAARDLRAWHVGLFWAGLACDATATEIMRMLTAAGEHAGVIHTVTGVTAIALMAAHAAWATFVLVRGTPEARRGFHRYSIVVWAVWLVPYLGGMIAGIGTASGAGLRTL